MPRPTTPPKRPTVDWWLGEVRYRSGCLTQLQRVKLCEMFAGGPWPDGHPMRDWNNAVSELLHAIEVEQQTAVQAWVADLGDIDDDEAG